MTTEESEQGQLPNLQAPSKPNKLWRISGWVKQKFLSLFSLNLRAKISQLTVSQYFYFAAFIVFIMKRPCFISEIFTHIIKIIFNKFLIF